MSKLLNFNILFAFLFPLMLSGCLTTSQDAERLCSAEGFATYSKGLYGCAMKKVSFEDARLKFEIKLNKIKCREAGHDEDTRDYHLCLASISTNSSYAIRQNDNANCYRQYSGFNKNHKCANFFGPQVEKKLFFIQEQYLKVLKYTKSIKTSKEKLNYYCSEIHPSLTGVKITNADVNECTTKGGDVFKLIKIDYDAWADDLYKKGEVHLNQCYEADIGNCKTMALREYNNREYAKIKRQQRRELNLNRTLKQIKKLSPTKKQRVYSEKICRSDFGCRYGEKCVKDTYKSEGFCAVKVNEYNNPTLEGPETDSFGVETERQCEFNSDCPSAYECISHACISD